MSRWHQWKQNSWRPSGCAQQHASDYVFTLVEKPVLEVPSSIIYDGDDKPPRQRLEGIWCAACMRTAFEPYSFKCGHCFCRRCLANLTHILTNEFTDATKDPRVSLRCPLGGCKNSKVCLPCRETTPALPFLNGDFRFKDVRPCDKVQIKKDSSCQLTEDEWGYRVEVDVDTTIKASEFLFDDEAAC